MTKGGGPGGKKKKKAFCKLAAKGLGPIGNRKGVFFTCDTSNQSQAQKEAYRVIQEHMEVLYPEQAAQAEKSVTDAPSTDAHSSKTDSPTVSQLLAAELQELRKEESTKKERYKIHEMGCAGVFFMAIQVEQADMCLLLDRIFQEAETSQILPLKFIHKMIPVTKSATVRSAEDVVELIKSVALPVLNDPTDPDGKTWCLMPTFRHTDPSLSKDTVIADFGASVESKNRVQLTDPDWVVFVEVIKTHGFVSVANKWRQNRKYNIRMTMEAERAKAQVQSDISMKLNAEKAAQKAAKAADTETREDAEATAEATADTVLPLKRGLEVESTPTEKEKRRKGGSSNTRTEKGPEGSDE